MQVRSRGQRLLALAATATALAASPPAAAAEPPEPVAAVAAVERLAVERVAAARGAAPVAAAEPVAAAGAAPVGRHQALVSGERLDGGGQADPVGQAIATSRARFDDGEAQRVVLVTADRFPDALGGSALAGDRGAVLYTSGAGLDPRTAAEITRLTGGHGGLVILGGEAAVPSAAADAALAAAGGGDCAAPLPPSCRIAGQERVETAALAAAVVRAQHPEAADLAVVARADDVADALTGGAFAAAAGVPLVLTARDVASAPARDFLAAAQVGEVIALGGTAAVADEVLAALAGGARRGRVAGAERTATSAAIARELWPRLGAGSGTAVLVNVRHPAGWQTALAAAPLAAALRAPQLGVDGPPAVLGAEVAATLAPLDRVVIAGDEVLVDRAQRLAALAALRAPDGGSGGTGGGAAPAPRARDLFPAGAVAHWSENNATRQALAWRETRPSDAALLAKIAEQPMASWLGEWTPDVRATAERETNAAVAAGTVPVFIAYNIPGRDCGSYSAGGQRSPQAYREWIGALAQGIGDRPAAVVLEPDALGLLTCLAPPDQQVRLDLLRDAVRTLGAGARTAVYLDAGSSNWLRVDEAVARLRAAGVDEARGFALNVSGFQRTPDLVDYGVAISQGLGGPDPARFVIDTSRNGNGPLPAAEDPTGEPWCNPPGRALGERPTTATPHPLADALLWLKVPGESDGTCRNGPPAGTFWPDYALGLAAG